MASIEQIMDDARSWLRDFPQYFTASVARSDNSRTFRIPHSNVIPGSLHVWSVATTGTPTVKEGYLHTTNFAPTNGTFSYTIDERNGLMRVVTAPSNGFAADTHINIEGYYTEWVADRDLKFHVQNVIAEHFYNRNANMERLSDAEVDVIALGAAVEAMWALAAEFSRDTDQSSVEGLSAPDSQRFRQVMAMLDGLVSKYRSKALMMGVGLERVQSISMRRTSRWTHRLVPVHQSREWDDIRPPGRVFPEIDRQGPTTPPLDFKPAAVVAHYDDDVEPNP